MKLCPPFSGIALLHEIDELALSAGRTAEDEEMLEMILNSAPYTIGMFFC